MKEKERSKKTIAANEEAVMREVLLAVLGIDRQIKSASGRIAVEMEFDRFGQERWEIDLRIRRLLQNKP